MKTETNFSRYFLQMNFLSTKIFLPNLDPVFAFLFDLDKLKISIFTGSIRFEGPRTLLKKKKVSA